MDRSFLKHAATYGLATLLTQAGGFVLLPLYLRCLGPSDYGALEIIGRLAETFAALLLFGGLRQALMTFYQQAPDEAARRRVVGATLALVVGSCVLGGGLALAFAPQLGELLAPGKGEPLDPWLIRLGVLTILVEPLCLVPLGLLQARVESKTYVLVVVGQFVVRVGLCVALVRFLNWGVAGALTATAATSALFALLLLAREARRGIAIPDLAQLRAMVSFALPMLPGGLCFFVLHHGDRFFLLRAADPGQVGLYALGYKLALLVGLFSLNPLYMVWSSRMYEAAKRDDAPVVFGRVFVRVVAAYLFVGLGLCLFAREAVVVLGGEDYLAAAAVIPPVVLACLCQSASSLMDAGLYVKRRTGLKLGVTVATTAVMLALYALLIPTHHGMGAALATLGGFAFLALATYCVTQRVFRVSYPWGRLAGLVALAVGLWLAGWWLPPAGWAIAAKAGLWLAAPPIAWFAGLVSADEKRFVTELVGRTLSRLRRPPALPLAADR